MRTSSICRSVNGSTRFRESLIDADRLASRSNDTPSSVRCLPSVAWDPAIFRVGDDIRDMHDLAIERHSSRDAAVTGRNGARAQEAQYSGSAATDEVATIAVDLALAHCDCSGIGGTKPAAVSTTVSSTGCRSEVERLMTLSTSLVAVWYSSDSWRSPVRCAIRDRSRRW